MPRFLALAAEHRPVGLGVGHPLAPDGYGFSDTRAALRRHFETDASHVAVAVLSGLAQQGEIRAEAVAKAIRRYGIDPDSIDPREA
jgi:pyruvate dehydrogenase E1 component